MRIENGVVELPGILRDDFGQAPRVIARLAGDGERGHRCSIRASICALQTELAGDIERPRSAKLHADKIACSQR